MPEGDTIHVAARNLRKILVRQTVSAAMSRHDLVDAERMIGRIVVGIEARGKHLLMHFDNDLVLHSHMGMTGSWHIYRRTDAWQKPRQQAFLSMDTSQFQAVCFTPRILKLLTVRQLLRDSYLQRLGPDLLGPPIPPETIIRRFRTQNAVAIGEAVMNQTVVSGIGNVYKSEVLFLERVHPLQKVTLLSDSRLLAICDRAKSLMVRNVDGRMRTTRFAADGIRTWVYGRGGELCLECGERVQIIRQGDLARSTYFCSECQS